MRTYGKSGYEVSKGVIRTDKNNLSILNFIAAASRRTEMDLR